MCTIMGSPRKKQTSPARPLPPIPPDALFHPWLLSFAKKLRKGKAVGFDEKWAVPITWEAKDLATIHDGLREWYKHGTFEKLAALLKDDPSRMVHPIIMLQMRHLANFSGRFEEADSMEGYIEEQHGPLLPKGTRLAARAALLTIFQGMWSAFSPFTVLHWKYRKRLGNPGNWEEGDREYLLDEYNTLRERLNDMAEFTDATEYPFRRAPKEAAPTYLKRIIEVVQQLHLTTLYSWLRKRGGPPPSDDLSDKRQQTPLPSSVARAIAQQAIPKHSVQKHILLVGMIAHYWRGDHTQWKKLEGDIQRAEEKLPDLHARKSRLR